MSDRFVMSQHYVHTPGKHSKKMLSLRGGWEHETRQEMGRGIERTATSWNEGRKTTSRPEKKKNRRRGHKAGQTRMIDPPNT